MQGDGPLVICIPGMGDLRSTYRFLVPTLVAAGYRVATMDLRGHGESSCVFESYDDEALASDVIALAESLGGPAVLIGNSMGAGAAVIAAAARPDLVTKSGPDRTLCTQLDTFPGRSPRDAPGPAPPLGSLRLAVFPPSDVRHDGAQRLCRPIKSG